MYLINKVRQRNIIKPLKKNNFFSLRRPFFVLSERGQQEGYDSFEDIAIAKVSSDVSTNARIRFH